MAMAPGKEIEIPVSKDMDVTSDGHHGSQDASHDVIHDDPDLVAAVALVDAPDNFQHPFLSVDGGPASTDDHVSISSSSTRDHPKPEDWEKKLEIDGTGADNVDVLPLGNKRLYLDVTFHQAWEFKLECHDGMQGVRSPSGTFYACLACTLLFDMGSTEGIDHHPVCKENPSIL